MAKKSEDITTNPTLEKRLALFNKDLELACKDKDNTKEFTCPRCGILKLETSDIALNAVSRYYNSYICYKCGHNESMRDLTNMEKFSILMWDFNNNEEGS